MKTRPPLIMDQVLTLHKLGRSSLEIAVELNLTRPVVYTAMRRLEKKGLVAKRDGTDAEKSYSLLLESRTARGQSSQPEIVASLGTDLWDEIAISRM